MDTSRRDFLKLSAAAAAIPFIPILWKLPPKHVFSPYAEYGNMVPMAPEHKANFPPQVILEILHRDAKSILPKGCVYEIRSMLPEMFGRRKGVAWYHNRRTKWGTKHCQETDGYIFISRHQA